MLATIAWGNACEALGHANGVADTQPSELSLAQVDAARAEMYRSCEALNEALTAVGLGPILATVEL
jgi:hypothetical protein